MAQAGKPRDFYEAQRSEPGFLQNLDTLHIRVGNQNLRQRYFQGAFNEAQFVLSVVPNHPQGLILLVQTCEQWPTPKCLVEETFQRAIAVNPNAAGTHTTQGIYLHRKHRYKEAIESFKRALEVDPTSLNAHYNIGLAYLETKQYDLANQHAQRAYALGAPFPGLRKKLEQVGYWKPIAAPEPKPADSPPRAPAEPPDEPAKK